MSFPTVHCASLCSVCHTQQYIIAHSVISVLPYSKLHLTLHCLSCPTVHCTSLRSVCPLLRYNVPHSVDLYTLLQYTRAHSVVSVLSYRIRCRVCPPLQFTTAHSVVSVLSYSTLHLTVVSFHSYNTLHLTQFDTSTFVI